jgi:hypothetical protein
MHLTVADRSSKIISAPFCAVTSFLQHAPIISNNRGETHTLQIFMKRAVDAAGLHYRSRPTPGEISAGLKPLAKCVAATIAVLEALDADTRRLLENEFDQSTGEVEIIVDGEQVGYQVKADALNIYGVRSRLKVLEKLIASAKKKLGPRKSPRKIKLVDEDLAIHALLKVWRDAAKGTSKPPCPTELRRPRIRGRHRCYFEQPVKKSDGHGGFIDLLWKGILLVEQRLPTGQGLFPRPYQPVDEVGFA